MSWWFVRALRIPGHQVDPPPTIATRSFFIDLLLHLAEPVVRDDVWDSQEDLWPVRSLPRVRYIASEVTRVSGPPILATRHKSRHSKHGVDSEVPAGEILAHVGHEAHLVGVAKVGVRALHAIGGDLHRLVVDHGRHGTMVWPAPRSGCALEGVGNGVRR